MPELPEVEVICTELRTVLPGKELSNIDIKWHKTFINYHKSIIGRKIVSIDRRGKYIIFNLDEDYLITHLRMTGQYILNKDNLYEQKHLRVILSFTCGLNLLYYDVRKFGRINWTNDINRFFENIGIDALDPELNADKFYNLISHRNISIKAFLLNQKYIAGLGNIYCDESLFKSGIHPGRIAKNIGKKKVIKLYDAIKITLESSIENMGATISDYKTTGGGFGRNQNHLQVYSREGKSCYACSNTIIKTRLAGRGTYYCPKCQS